MFSKVMVAPLALGGVASMYHFNVHGLMILPAYAAMFASVIMIYALAGICHGLYDAAKEAWSNVKEGN
jgi:hypothetical protein